MTTVRMYLLEMLLKCLRNPTARYHVKRFAKSVLRNHVYVAKGGLAKGLKVSGDLGFLREPYITYEDRFLMSLDLAGKTIYDVGSHIGILSLFFSRAAGEEGRVFSFEPNPETFAILCGNIRLNNLTNVTPLNLALGERRDTMPLTYAQHDGALGTLDESEKTLRIGSRAGQALRTALVQVYPLDDFVHNESLPEPNFVKIDVEGYEYNVLLGMQKIIQSRKPSLLVEVHGWTPELRQTNRRNVIDLLTANGYELYDVASGESVTGNNFHQACHGSLLAGQ